MEEEILDVQVQKNRLEELALAKADKTVLVRTEGDEKGVAMPKLTVKMDGSWSKAGFTSNFGFAVVLSTRTGKVLDYEFLSKYCGKCNMAKGAQTGDDPQPCENCRVSSGNIAPGPPPPLGNSPLD